MILLNKIFYSIFFILITILVSIFLLFRFSSTNHHHHHKDKFFQQATTNNNAKKEWTVGNDGTVIHEGNGNIIERNYTIHINNVEKCNNLRNDTISFLIMILSTVDNFDRRQIIRETWALDLMQQLGNYRVLFIVGLTNSNDTQERLRFESLINEDIVQININDNFDNLTYKSIHMLRWYQMHCSNAKFLIKTDDDIYLHIPNIIDWLKQIKTTAADDKVFCRRNISRKILRNSNIKNLFLYSSSSFNHHQQHHRTIIDDKQLIERSRKKFQRYVIEYKQLPGILYPEYCSGFAYVMNKMVAQKLFNASKTIPYIGIEDVFITGFCRYKSNITIVDTGRFRLNPHILPIESRCQFDDNDGRRITSNELSVDQMKTLWTHVNTHGFYCKFNNNTTTIQI